MAFLWAMSVFQCVVCESLFLFPGFSVAITECGQLIRESLILSQR